MSEHTAQVTLEVLADMLGDVRGQQRLILQRIEDFEQSSKLRDEKILSEIRTLSGTIATLNVSVEELEVETGRVAREFARINQALEGLTQLGSTNFDQNASILEAITGTKGADRPQRQSKPGSNG